MLAALSGLLCFPAFAWAQESEELEMEIFFATSSRWS